MNFFKDHVIGIFVLSVVAALVAAYLDGVIFPSHYAPKKRPESAGETISAQTGDGSHGSPAAASDPRNLIRPDTLKLSGRWIVVPPPDTISLHWYNPTVNLLVENLSGRGIGLGVLAGSLTAGPCHQWSAISGLPNIAGDQQWNLQSLPWIPSGAKIAITSELDPKCPQELSQMTRADVSLTLLVALDDKVMWIPSTATDVPIREGSQ